MAIGIALELIAGTVLLSTCTLLVSLWGLQSQRRHWRRVQQEMETLTQQRITGCFARLDQLEARMDRIIPIAHVTVVASDKKAPP